MFAKSSAAVIDLFVLPYSDNGGEKYFLSYRRQYAQSTNEARATILSSQKLKPAHLSKKFLKILI